MPDYDVTIRTTKVGDPTVVFAFSLAGASPIEALTVELGFKGQSFIFNLSNVEMNKTITLMESFADSRRASSPTVDGTVSFTDNNADTFNGIPDNVSFDVVTNENLPNFTLPSEGSALPVAIQCIDDQSGNNVFLGMNGDSLPLSNQFSSWNGQVWTLQSQANGTFFLRNNISGICLTLNGSAYLTITDINGKSFYISNDNYYLIGNTGSRAQASPQEGRPSSNNNAAKWYFHNLQ